MEYLGLLDWVCKLWFGVYALDLGTWTPSYTWHIRTLLEIPWDMAGLRTQRIVIVFLANLL